MVRRDCTIHGPNSIKDSSESWLLQQYKKSGLLDTLVFQPFYSGRICFSFPIAFQGWIKSINDIYVVISTCLFPKIYSKWLLPCSLWRSKLAVQLLKCRNSYKFKKIRHFQCEKHYGTLFEKGLQSLQKILNCAIKGEWQELGQISNANYSP